MTKCEGKLTLENILRLVQGDIDVLVTDNYVESRVCQKFSGNLIEYGYKSYINAPSIGRFGMALYEAENNPELLENYYSNALINIEKTRELFLPYATPIDSLRCNLE